MSRIASSTGIPRVIVAVATLLVGFVSAGANDLRVTLQSRGTTPFAEDGVIIGNDHPGARLEDVKRLGPGRYQGRVAPEAHPINDSAWTSLPADRVTVSPHRTEAELKLDVGPAALWVSARENLNGEIIEGWLAGLAARRGVVRRVAGRSFAGRPIHHAVIGDPKGTNLVFLISRQHPPEVSGALGLLAFVDRITDESESSRDFRRRFTTHVFPLMNPDGVHEGHWRRNFGNRDLNRTWTTAEEPEIRVVRDAIVDLARPGCRTWLFLDFHSTRFNIFYTQSDEFATVPPDFTRRWLAAIGRRVPAFDVNRGDNHIPGHHTSKSWAHDTFGCPAITWEFDDHVDRGLLREAAAAGADEMARLLLEAVEQPGGEAPDVR